MNREKAHCYLRILSETLLLDVPGLRISLRCAPPRKAPSLEELNFYTLVDVTTWPYEDIVSVSHLAFPLSLDARRQAIERLLNHAECNALLSHCALNNVLLRRKSKGGDQGASGVKCLNENSGGAAVSGDYTPIANSKSLRFDSPSGTPSVLDGSTENAGSLMRTRESEVHEALESLHTLFQFLLGARSAVDSLEMVADPTIPFTMHHHSSSSTCPPPETDEASIGLVRFQEDQVRYEFFRALVNFLLRQLFCRADDGDVEAMNSSATPKLVPTTGEKCSPLRFSPNTSLDAVSSTPLNSSKASPLEKHTPTTGSHMRRSRCMRLHTEIVFLCNPGTPWPTPLEVKQSVQEQLQANEHCQERVRCEGIDFRVAHGVRTTCNGTMHDIINNFGYSSGAGIHYNNDSNGGGSSSSSRGVKSPHLKTSPMGTFEAEAGALLDAIDLYEAACPKPVYLSLANAFELQLGIAPPSCWGDRGSVALGETAPLRTAPPTPAHINLCTSATDYGCSLLPVVSNTLLHFCENSKNETMQRPTPLRVQFEYSVPQTSSDKPFPIGAVLPPRSQPCPLHCSPEWFEGLSDATVMEHFTAFGLIAEKPHAGPSTTSSRTTTTTALPPKLLSLGESTKLTRLTADKQGAALASHLVERLLPNPPTSLLEVMERHFLFEG